MSTATVIPFPPENIERKAAIERYHHLYRVAEKAIDFAETVKLTGIFLSGILVITGLIAYQVNRADHSGFPTLAVSLIACAIPMVLAAHLWEMVFSAVGHLLEAAVDSAVNSSPFLSNPDRAQVISLGRNKTTA